MPKDTLNDITIRKAKLQDKPYKLTDGRGLYLLVNGVGKYWRLDYRSDGKRKILALGVYPDVPLAKARERREEARQQIADGIDPGAVRKAQKESTIHRRANTFEVIAREWYGKHASGWASSHSDKIIRLMERDLFPWLGPSRFEKWPLQTSCWLCGGSRIEVHWKRHIVLCSIVGRFFAMPSLPVGLNGIFLLI